MKYHPLSLQRKHLIAACEKVLHLIRPVKIEAAQTLMPINPMKMISTMVLQYLK